MFPIEGENNKMGKHSIFPYRGVRLRLRSKKKAQLCSKAVKTKDMGVFPLYLFVKISVRENKSYVKSVTNISKVRQWYIEQNKKKKVKG
jgi:hypothetical protein